MASAWCKFAGIVLAFEIFCLAWLIAFGGFLLASPSASPEQADLIVVLGGGSGDRLVKGGQIFRQGYADHILITGCSDENMLVRPLHTNWRAAYLQQLGIPESAIFKDSSAANSWQEARLVRRLMLENEWRKVLVVSDPPHLFRLSWIFKHSFESTGLSYRFIASEPIWWNAAKWWSRSASAIFVIEEFLKIVYYGLEYD